jgi:hypothetical protein
LLDEDSTGKNYRIDRNSKSFAGKELEKTAAFSIKAEKILILAGQQNPNPQLEKILADI